MFCLKVKEGRRLYPKHPLSELYVSTLVMSLLVKVSNFDNSDSILYRTLSVLHV